MLKQIRGRSSGGIYVEYGAPRVYPRGALLHAHSPTMPTLMRTRHYWLQHSTEAIVPYLRGFGPTRFLSSDLPRSGQQAAWHD